MTGGEIFAEVSMEKHISLKNAACLRFAPATTFYAIIAE
jgi:hypothetical protein